MTIEKKFIIKSNKFEGPFEKILELIEKKKLSINDVSLSKITDDFLIFLKENEIKLIDTTKFVWVASILLLLKSKSLLPSISFNKEDNQDINELNKRLKILSVYRENLEIIEKLYKGNNIHKKLVIKQKKEIKFSPDTKINFKNLLLVLENLIKRIKIEKKLPEKKIEKQKSLKEITAEITKKIERYLEISFKELVTTKDKKETSASFISILELFRNNFIDLQQTEDFGEIMIKKKEKK